MGTERRRLGSRLTLQLFTARHGVGGTQNRGDEDAGQLRLLFVVRPMLAPRSEGAGVALAFVYGRAGCGF
jgi:hypothetical protein